MRFTHGRDAKLSMVAPDQPPYIPITQCCSAAFAQSFGRNARRKGPPHVAPCVSQT